jgi:hypothetical protein
MRCFYTLTYLTLTTLLLLGCTSSSPPRNQTTNYVPPSPTTETSQSVSKPVSTVTPNAAKSLVEKIERGDPLQTEEEREKNRKLAANNPLKPLPNKPKKCVDAQRTFADDPKIVSITMDFANGSCKSFTYRVQLRNGRICDVPEGKLRRPMTTASAEEIFEAIADCARN